MCTCTAKKFELTKPNLGSSLDGFFRFDHNALVQYILLVWLVVLEPFSKNVTYIIQ